MVPIETQLYRCPCTWLIYRRTKPTDPPRGSLVQHYDYQQMQWRTLRDGEQPVPRCPFCLGQAVLVESGQVVSEYDQRIYGEEKNKNIDRATQYTPSDRLLWQHTIEKSYPQFGIGPPRRWYQ